MALGPEKTARSLSGLTEAEALFEWFCAERNIPLVRLPEGVAPTPDYELTLGARRIAVEVKQLEPNAADLAYSEELKREGRASRFINMGRARQSMHDAVEQLRPHAKGRMPAVALLYDTMGIGSVYLDSRNIGHCMYGVERVHLVVAHGSAVEPLVLGSSYGGGRVVTERHNTTLSAVAVLRFVPEEQRIALFVYHNAYAALPLSPDEFRLDDVYHYVLAPAEPGHLPRWQER
jgi:hypothetical protein